MYNYIQVIEILYTYICLKYVYIGKFSTLTNIQNISYKYLHVLVILDIQRISLELRVKLHTYTQYSCCIVKLLKIFIYKWVFVNDCGCEVKL